MFALPLPVRLQPSRRLRLLTLAVHLPALSAVWLADLDAGLQIALSGLVLASALWSGLRPQISVELRCKADGGLEIRQGADWLAAQVGVASVVLPGLTLLRYQPAGMRRGQTLVILADSLAEGDFRRFRVWLRWRARLAGPA